MVVRVKWQYGTWLEKFRHAHRQATLTSAFFLNALSVGAYVLGFWRLGADLSLTGEFAISRGLFSHWQVWLSLAVVLQVIGVSLNRYAHADETQPHTEEAR